MTIADLTPLVEYLEDGATLNFPVPFRFLAPTDLVAARNIGGVLTVLAYGSQYNVTGGETDAGGTLTLIASVPGAVLQISRDTARSQQTDYQTNDSFPAETHEAALDKLTAIVQEQDVDRNAFGHRALRVPVGETVPDLPPALLRAQGLLGFDALGDPIIMPPSDQQSMFVGPDAPPNPHQGMAWFESDTGITWVYYDDGITAKWIPANVGSAASSNYIQSGAGAVVRPSQDKMRERVTPQDFGARGNGTGDDTAALNAFFAEVATGRAGHIPSGRYDFTAPLNVINGNGVRVTGDGETALLFYKGASTTPGDLLKFGDGTVARTNLHLSGFGINSLNSLTSGFAIVVRNTSKIEIVLTMDGGSDLIMSRLWDGISLVGCTRSALDGKIQVPNTGVKWQDGVVLNMGRTFIKGAGGGVAVWLAGGCMDFNAERMSVLLKGEGLRIDNSASAAANGDIFINEASKIDTCTDNGIVIDDSNPADAGKLIKLDGWVATTLNGPCVRIINWPAGRIDSALARITNSQNNHGIYSADPTCILNLGDSVQIHDNSQYGVASAVGWKINSRANVINNHVGQYHPNILNAGIRVAFAPMNFWGIDFAQDGFRPCVSTASITFPVGSGLVIVCNDSNAHYGMFMCMAGSVTKIVGDADMVAGPPAANQIGVNFSGGFYRVTNNLATTQNLYISNFKTRASS